MEKYKSLGFNPLPESSVRAELTATGEVPTGALAALRAAVACDDCLYCAVVSESWVEKMRGGGRGKIECHKVQPFR